MTNVALEVFRFLVLHENLLVVELAVAIPKSKPGLRLLSDVWVKFFCVAPRSDCITD